MNADSRGLIVFIIPAALGLIWFSSFSPTNLENCSYYISGYVDGPLCVDSSLLGSRITENNHNIRISLAFVQGMFKFSFQCIY